MRMCIRYLENYIDINNSNVFSIEVKDPKLFYRMVCDLNSISCGNINEDVYFYEGLNELNMTKRIRLVIDYFNIDFNEKANINCLNDYLYSNISDTSVCLINDYYNKIKDIVFSSLSDTSISIDDESNFSLQNVFKLYKLHLKEPNDLLSKIYLLIDIYKEFYKDNLIIFVNLKQLLSFDEISEVYKYIMYNELYCMFLDNFLYKRVCENEKKLIIDDDLVETML